MSERDSAPKGQSSQGLHGSGRTSMKMLLAASRREALGGGALKGAAAPPCRAHLDSRPGRAFMQSAPILRDSEAIHGQRAAISLTHPVHP